MGGKGRGLREIRWWRGREQLRLVEGRPHSACGLRVGEPGGRAKEDEAELVSFSLELSEHENLEEARCEVVKALISKILSRYGQLSIRSQY